MRTQEGGGVLATGEHFWILKKVGAETLNLVFKTITRSLVGETVGMVWVLGGLWDGRCK